MSTVNIRDTAQWASLLSLQPPRPLLVHLNGDTTWLLQIPYPSSTTAVEASTSDSQRAHFNVLIDPWLHGPQSDVASWFSTQVHVVAPAVASLAELQTVLKRVDGAVRKNRAADVTEDADVAADGGEEPSYIDVVAISHEFTDHCHKATLHELPRNTPIYAADVAADLIRSWNYFDADAVITTPGLAKDAPWTSLSAAKLPSWLRIGRLITPGNSLYYHSALILAFNLPKPSSDASEPSLVSGEAVVYSPHGISAADVAALPTSSLSTLAMLHGLHDVRLFMMKQLNLGALNAIEAVQACGAKYWVGTHDEEKTGKGLIAPLLRRTRYTLRQAVVHDEKRRAKEKQSNPPGELGDKYKELGSGAALLLT